MNKDIVKQQPHAKAWEKFTLPPCVHFEIYQISKNKMKHRASRKYSMSNNLIFRPLGDARLHRKSRNNQIAVQSYCFFLIYARKIVTK